MKSLSWEVVCSRLDSWVLDSSSDSDCGHLNYKVIDISCLDLSYVKGQNWTVARIHSCSNIPTTYTFSQLLAISKDAVCGHRADENKLGQYNREPFDLVHSFNNWLINPTKAEINAYLECELLLCRREIKY